jgi:Xaa-Pro aminopeptidase
VTDLASDVRARRAHAAEGLQRAGLEGMVLGDKYNYWYFTGHLSREFDKKMRPMLFLLTSAGVAGAVCYRQAEKDLRRSCPDISVFTYEDVPFDVEVLSEGLRELGLERGRVGMELGENERLGMPYRDLQTVVSRHPALELEDAGPLIQRLRAIKSPFELEALRRAASMSLQAWSAALERCGVGATNPEIATIVGAELAVAGSDVNIAGHVSVGNGVAGGSPYQPGDVVWCDFGGTYRGYQADMARRAVFGSPTERQLDIHERISDVLETQIGAIGPGVPARDVARVASDRLVDVGFAPLGARKRVGHGVGLAPAEPPSLSLADDTVLRPGMVLTPEPRFNLETGEKVHIEEMVVVTETGCEKLTDGAARLDVIEA